MVLAPGQLAGEGALVATIPAGPAAQLAPSGAGMALVPSEAGQAAVIAAAPHGNAGLAEGPGNDKPPGVLGSLPQGSGQGDGPQGTQLDLTMDLGEVIQLAD